MISSQTANVKIVHALTARKGAMNSACEGGKHPLPTKINQCNENVLLLLICLSIVQISVTTNLVPLDGVYVNFILNTLLIKKQRLKKKKKKMFTPPPWAQKGKLSPF